MANYKRRKCRYNCYRSTRGSTTAWRAKHGFKPVRIDFNAVSWPEWKASWRHPRGRSYLNQMNSSPAWHKRTYNMRPKRVATKRLEKRIVKGQIDPDDTAWPLASRKPTNYYW